MSKLFEKLVCINKIKDNKTRLSRLKDECSNRDILNDALEIAKHESSMNLPGAILVTALSAIIITVLITISKNLIPEAMITVELFLFIIIYFAVLLYLVKFEFGAWTNLYYDLIDLRREEPDISKLDIIISKVVDINPRINELETKVSTKLEDIKKEIISLKKK